MVGVRHVDDIDTWPAPWAGSAAPPGQYTLAEHIRARLGPSRPRGSVAWGPSKWVHITAAKYRAVASISAQLQISTGCPGVQKDITGSLGSERGVRQDMHVQELARKHKCLLWLDCTVLLEVALSESEHWRVWGACDTKQHS